MAEVAGFAEAAGLAQVVRRCGFRPSGPPWIP